MGSLIAAAIENARLYAEVETQKEALERRVVERTAALASAIEEAQAARVVAEAASASKSAFLSSVSHELRTPLTSVVGFSRLIRRRLDEVIFPTVPAGDPKRDRAVRQVSENLGIIIEEGERLTTLINDTLDLAKIEAGRMEWRRDPVDIAEVIARATSATASLLSGPGPEMVIDVEPRLPSLIGDRDRLIQVAINLISNAVKFTPSGSITCAARQDPTSGTVIVSVSDTGVGIAPEDHARVFEQFGQAGDTLTDKPRGTGLGLVDLSRDRGASRRPAVARIRAWERVAVLVQPAGAARWDGHRRAGSRRPGYDGFHGVGRGATWWMISNPVVFDRTSTSVPWKRMAAAPLPARRLPIVSSGNQSGSAGST